MTLVPEPLPHRWNCIERFILRAVLVYTVALPVAGLYAFAS